jgi:GT2 family glycosyltransferase
MHPINVTVIIPVYKDWETLSKCISSLKLFLDSRHTVLLINDLSSEAEVLETNILSSIKDSPHFKYFKNDKNIGFVKTCNRGVFELDNSNNDILLLNSDTEVTAGFLEEMIDILHLHEKHGVVCPRSNNATILSVPFNYEKDRDQIVNLSLDYFNKLKSYLPRFTTIPTGVGFCMLIRKSLITNFGLFDEIYGKGYNEENDFCCRINRYGYSAVMANHAFVFHFESRSFTPEEKKSQNEKNEKILTARYPEYFPAVKKYLQDGIHPADYFSKIICQAYPKKRILISLYNLPEAYNGTAQYGLSLLESFLRLYGHKYDINLLSNKKGAVFHQLDKLYGNILCYPDDLMKSEKIYDLAISPSQIFDINHLKLLNRHALKIVFSLQDIIAWRCNYLKDDTLDFILKYSIIYSDGIIAISNFSKEDTLYYFESHHFFKHNFNPIKVIYHGISKKKDFQGLHPEESRVINNLRNEPFILLLGNHYYHKSIALSLEHLFDVPIKIVVLGINKDELINKIHFELPKNTLFLKSGQLSEDFVDFLYSECELVIYPSQYEGFGLPIITALSKGKIVIVFDNEINKELIENNMRFIKNIIYFKNYYDLNLIINKIINNNSFYFQTTPDIFRTWDNVAEETERFLAEVMESNINIEKLEKRWLFFNYLQIIQDDSYKQGVRERTMIPVPLSITNLFQSRYYIFLRDLLYKLKNKIFFFSNLFNNDHKLH